MQENSDFALPKMPPRPTDGHKGTFGRTLILAGSRGMSGAVCLAGTAALRGGAGLVSVACPQGIQSIVAGYEPGYMTIGLLLAKRVLVGRLVLAGQTSWKYMRVSTHGYTVGRTNAWHTTSTY